MSRVPDHSTRAPGTRKAILTVVDLVAMLLQALDIPLLQHPVSHQQLEEPPVDVSHGAHTPRTALHGGVYTRRKRNHHLRAQPSSVLGFVQMCMDEYKLAMVFKIQVIIVSSTETKRTQARASASESWAVVRSVFWSETDTCTHSLLLLLAVKLGNSSCFSF